MTTYAYLCVSTDRQDVANQRYGFLVCADIHRLRSLRFVETPPQGGSSEALRSVRHWLRRCGQIASVWRNA